MPNMSYCRFRNTNLDLDDCVDFLREHNYDVEAIQQELSDSEFHAYVSLVELCREVTLNLSDEDE